MGEYGHGNSKKFQRPMEGGGNCVGETKGGGLARNGGRRHSPNSPVPNALAYRWECGGRLSSSSSRMPSPLAWPNAPLICLAPLSFLLPLRRVGQVPLGPMCVPCHSRRVDVASQRKGIVPRSAVAAGGQQKPKFGGKAPMGSLWTAAECLLTAAAGPSALLQKDCLFFLAMI